MTPQSRALDLATIRARVARIEPAVEPDPPAWQAATALAVAPGADGAEIAFIRRTERPGDRWSGQMALPGGRRDPGDVDLAATAAREAAEEVGLALPEPTGRLDDQRGRLHRGVIATFVYVLDHRPELHPDPSEVARARWIGVAQLLDPSAATRTRWAGVPFPAIEHDGEVIWGLTHRILGSFATAIGAHLPQP